MEVFSVVPAISGFAGVVIMTIFLRRARYLHLPETQMIRAVGSFFTKNYDTALLPGTVLHFVAGIAFAYFYALFLTTAPDTGGNPAVPIVVCTLIGFVHGLIVTLFLVITVAQYHPLDQFRKLDPGDMGSHVIAHVAYGATVGFGLAYLPQWLG